MSEAIAWVEVKQPAGQQGCAEGKGLLLGMCPMLRQIGQAKFEL